MKNFFLKLKNYFKEAKAENVYSLDGCVPLVNAIPFGLQHALSMFIGNISPIILVCAFIKDVDNSVIQQIIQNGIFIAGIATAIQLFPIWRFGSKLPIVSGISFTFVGVLISVVSVYGYGTMLGSIIVGGLFIGVFGLLAKYWRRFIPPIVSSLVVLAIGLSLLSVGAKTFCGGEGLINNPDAVYGFASWQNLLVATITLVSGIVLNIVLKGVWKNLSILFSLLIGVAISLFFKGMIVPIDFGDLPIFSLPKFTSFGEITFNLEAIVIVVVIYLVSSTETIGNVSAICDGALEKEVTEKEIAGGISAVGFFSALSGALGCLPVTTYSQNIGMVTQTKVVNRFAILTGAIFLIIAGLFPPLAAVIQMIPQPVIGGCTILLFSSIVITGMQMLAKCGFNMRNTLIISLSLSIGFGFTLVPEIVSSIFPSVNSLGALILSNSVAMIFIISFVLNLVLPKNMDQKTSE